MSEQWPTEQLDATVTRFVELRRTTSSHVGERSAQITGFGTSAESVDDSRGLFGANDRRELREPILSRSESLDTDYTAPSVPGNHRSN